MTIFLALNLVSASLFLFYGLHCLSSEKMVAEFNRYGLAKYRRLTGTLEVAGALGQITGFWVPPVGLLASGGLALLMICGVWARWRIKDPWTAFIPAVSLGFINGSLFWSTLQKIGF